MNKWFLGLGSMLFIFTISSFETGAPPSDLKMSLAARYLDKIFYLKAPVPQKGMKVQGAATNYRILSEREKYFLFQIGEQIRIINIDAGKKEIIFTMSSLDSSRKTEISFSLSSSTEITLESLADLTQLWSKFFSPSLSSTDLDTLKKEYIQEQYRIFAETQASVANISPQGVHESVVRVNPTSRALMDEAGSLRLRLKDQETSINALEKERNTLRAKISSIQQEKQYLETSAKNSEEKIRVLQQAENDLKKQINQKTVDLDKLTKAIWAACSEVGIKADPAAPATKLLETLSHIYLQVSAGNSAYQSRLTQLQAELVKTNKDNQTLTQRLDQIQKEKNDQANKLETIMKQDKTLTQQMFQLEHEKNVIQTKLLSRSLLRADIQRKRINQEQMITVQLMLKDYNLGTILITAPTSNSPARPTRLTLESHMKTQEELARLKDPDLLLMLRHLDNFPRFDISIERRNHHFSLKDLQSPLKADTNLWVWEVVPEAKEDVDLVFHFQTHIAKESMPLFEVPVSIIYPTVEKTLLEYIQPVPFGVGIVIGLLIALPFFILSRRQTVQTNADFTDSPRKTLHLGDKEL